MNFKIISVGWECGSAWQKTVSSVLVQEHQDWQMHIVDDASSRKQQMEIEEWCKRGVHPIMLTLNTENLGAVRNQYEEQT